MQRSSASIWAQAEFHDPKKLPRIAISKSELATFANSLHTGDYITTREIENDSNTWYSTNENTATYSCITYLIGEKYAHVCVLYKRVGKRYVKTAMDYAKLYIASKRTGERFEK